MVGNFFKGRVDRLLVPVDFSPKSSLAIEHALVMARVYGSAVYLVHVLDATIFVAGSVPGVLMDIRERCEKALEELAAAVRQQHLDCSVLLREGDLNEQIQAVIAEFSIDVLVLGTKAGTAYAGLSFVSTAEHILRKTQIPVLTVADCHAVRKWGGEGCFHLLYATDLSPESIQSLSYARAVEHRLCVEFTVAHVLGKHASTAKIELVTEELKKMANGPSDKILVLHGSPGPAICEASRRAHADLIAIGVQKHSLLREVLLGHTLLEILSGASCPVLTFRM